MSLFPPGSAPGIVWDHSPCWVCLCLVQTTIRAEWRKCPLCECLYSLWLAVSPGQQLMWGCTHIFHYEGRHGVVTYLCLSCISFLIATCLREHYSCTYKSCKCLHFTFYTKPTGTLQKNNRDHSYLSIYLFKNKLFYKLGAGLPVF